MTAILGAPRLDTRFESVLVRAGTAVGAIVVIAVGSQPTERAISPLGVIALVVAAIRGGKPPETDAARLSD